MTNPVRSDPTPPRPRPATSYGSVPAPRPERASAGSTRAEREAGGVPVQPKLLNLSMYINEHLREELTLEVLAARMNLSPFHFHRKFRAYFGESLHQHIKRLRLERSAHALLYQLTPVSGVARSSGYKTLSAFSHAFSAHFGVAPTRFREVMLMGRLAGSGNELRERLGNEWIDRLSPSDVGYSLERPTAFLRAQVKVAEDLTQACQVIEQLEAMTGPAGEMIITSVDLFGVLTGAPLRLEVGHDVADIDPALVAQLGAAQLPGGRYAIFDFTGPPQLLIDAVRAIYHFWVPTSGERTRQTAHYVMTADGLGKLSTHWQIHVPLEDAAPAGQS